MVVANHPVRPDSCGRGANVWSENGRGCCGRITAVKVHVRHEVICKILDHAHVGEALLVLSHVDEEEQDGSVKPRRRAWAWAWGRGCSYCAPCRAQSWETRPVEACVTLDLPTRPGVGRVLRQEVQTPRRCRTRNTKEDFVVETNERFRLFASVFIVVVAAYSLRWTKKIKLYSYFQNNLI